MRSFESILVVLFAFYMPPAAVFAADSWPQFRGPDGTAIASGAGYPIEWSTEQNIHWKTPIPGSAWSSPIVWGDSIFVTTATNGNQTCEVLCLQLGDGSIRWRKEVFRQELDRKEDRNTYATPTPCTDGERVYACFGDGSFVALDFQGNIVWTNRDYPFYSQHGLGSSPIVFDGKLIMPRDGSSKGPDKLLGWQKPWDQSYIVALDARTGKESWKGSRGLSRISHGSAVIWQHASHAEVVSEAGDVVQGFDLNTGERLWSHEVLGEGKVPSTTLGEGVVFTAGGWGGKESVKAFRLGGEGELRESQLVWEQKKGIPKLPSLLYLKPYLYSVSDAGVASCLDASTGEIVRQNRIGGSFTSSPVSAEGRIYFTDDNGDTTVVGLGPSFEILAKNSIQEKVQATPALSQGAILIRTENNLICIRATQK